MQRAEALVRTPGVLATVDGLVSEIVFQPAVVLIGYAWWSSSLDAEDLIRGMVTAATCAAVTYWLRSRSSVSTMTLHHLVWMVVPIVVLLILFRAVADWAVRAAVGLVIFRGLWFAMSMLFRRAGPSSDGEPMTVLITADAVPPKVDGVSVFVRHACRELRALGHDVHVACSMEGESHIEGARVHRMWGFHPSVYPEHSATLPTPDFLLVLLRVRPTVVHMFDESFFNAGVVVMCWALAIPVVFSHHTRIDLYITYFLSDWPTWAAHALLFALRRTFTPFAGGHLAVCRPLYNQLRQLQCSRVDLWHSGCDLRLFSPEHRDRAAFRRYMAELSTSPSADADTRRAAAQAAASSALPVILYVGRLADEKDINVLPAIIEAVNPPHVPPRALFVIVGGGPAEARLRGLVGSRAVMPGKIPQGPLLSMIYATGDIFLTTCTTEAFALSMLEAMASGLFVIGPAAGGVLEAFDQGQEGLFYFPLNAIDAARAVTQAFDDLGAADPRCPQRLAARSKLEAQSWPLSYREAVRAYHREIHQLHQ